MISIQDREKIKNEFNSLTNIYELAHFLNTTKKQLIYYTVILPEDQRYSPFLIPKKSGGTRQIYAPVKTLKYIQKQLALRLQVLYEPLNVVHGFLKEYEDKNGKKVKPTVVSNAATHVRKKIILNIDLENFFPTVSKKRVYGLFKNQYSLNSKIASYLTFICSTENGLPQGAPTSPIITNMICSRLDRKLRRLSSENYVTYSRYADDLSFSTSKKKFPSDFESKVNEIIKAEGFSLNEKKRRLHLRENRLEVTGLTVNLKPNVQRRYVRNLRAIFHSIRKHGINAAAENYVKIKNVSINDPAESLKRYLKGKIEYLGQVKGKDDPVYIKFKQKFLEVFEPNKAIKDMPEPESSEFIDKRDKLLEKYNSEMQDSIIATSDETRNIKERIKQKLDKARKILLSPDKKNYYETIYLLWFSCLNEFQKMHFRYENKTETTYINGEIKDKKIILIYLDGERVDEKKYFSGRLDLPTYQNIGYLTDEHTKYSYCPSKNTSECIFLYLYEKGKSHHVLEFAWLNKIRNLLNLTHADEIHIRQNRFMERVNWEQCAWMFQFIYFLFTSRNVKNDNVFKQNFYLNNNFLENDMFINGNIEEIIEATDKVELLICFINTNSNDQHKIKGTMMKNGDAFKAFTKEKFLKGDFVKIKTRFYISQSRTTNNYFNNITILSIEKEPNPNYLAKDNKQ